MSEDNSTLTPIINDQQRIKPEHLEVLRERAITPEYAAKVGLYSISFPHKDRWAEILKKSHTAIKYLPHYPGLSGLGIPYPKALSDDYARLRVRLDQRMYDGKELPRYLCQSKPVTVIPYITPEVLDIAGDPSKPIYIVEAPLKACSLSCNGFPAIGLGGVSAGAHDSEISKTLGEVVASKEMQKRVSWRGRKIYVVFDAGVADNPQVAHGAAILWKTLSDLGADVWIVKIPYQHPRESDVENGKFIPEKDQGPDDYIFSHGVGAFRSRVDEAIPLGPEPLVKHFSSRPGELRDAVRSLHFQACLYVATTQGDAGLIADLASVLPKNTYGKRELSKMAAAFGQKMAARAKEESKGSSDIWERGDEAECASRLIAHFEAGSTIVADGGNLYRYTEGRYSAIESAELVTVSASWAGQPLADGQVLKVRHGWQLGGIKIALAMATKLGEKSGFFGGARNALGFKNGVLLVEKGKLVRNEDGTPKLHDHSPSWRLRAVYDFDYVPGLRPEKILAAARSLPKEGEKDLQCWGEFAGASLFGLATRFSRALLFLGAGGSGKSTLLSITKRAFPSDVVSTIAPQSLDVPCNRARLLGRRLNVVADMPERAFLDTGPFKAVITGDQIEARNLYEDPFDLSPIAGHLYAANRLFAHNDNSNGFRRRWIVIKFPSVIENKDLFFLEKIEDEIPALVSWFVDCLCTLLDRGDYDIPQTSEEIVSEWIRDGSQIEQFLDECAEVIPENERNAEPKKRKDEWTGSKLAFEEFSRWAERTKHKGMSMSTFGREMKAFLAFEDTKTEYGNFLPIKLLRTDDISEEEIEKLLYEKAEPKKDDAPTSSKREIQSPDPSKWAQIRVLDEKTIEVLFADGPKQIAASLAQVREKYEVEDFGADPYLRLSA